MINFVEDFITICTCMYLSAVFNTLRPTQNGHHFPNMLKWIFCEWKCIKIRLKFHWSFFPRSPNNNPLPLQVVIQWQSSMAGIETVVYTRMPLEKKLLIANVFPVCFQWSSSGLPVVFKCVPITKINTGLPLGYHWVIASASVLPMASQCTCVFSGLLVCSNYANCHCIATGRPLGDSISQCNSSVICPVVSQYTDRIWFGGH